MKANFNSKGVLELFLESEEDSKWLKKWQDNSRASTYDTYNLEKKRKEPSCKILGYLEDISNGGKSTDSVEMRLNLLEDELSKTTEEVNVINSQITHIFRKLEEQRALFKYQHGKKDFSDEDFLKPPIDAWNEYENKNRYELRKKFARSTLDKMKSFLIDLKTL